MARATVAISWYKELLSSTGSSPAHLGCRGLTGVIKEVFFPDYLYTGANRAELPRRGGRGGFARGRLVDREVQRWIQAGGGRVKKSAKLHLFSRAFIALTRRLELTPLAAQVVVRDEKCDIGTLVDGVFLNASGRVVVVELKTGFEGYKERSTGRMLAEFSHQTNSPVNQHGVQLAFTHNMFQRTFPQLGAIDALLIRMTGDGADVRGLSELDKKAVKRARRHSLAR